MEQTNYNPLIWGPKAWFFIDTIILSLPDTLDIQLQKTTKDFFINLQLLLPCEKCRFHYTNYINNNINNIDFSKKKDIQDFIFRLHNEISIRNKKNPRTTEQVLQYYDKQYKNIDRKYDIFYLIILILIILYIIKKIQN
jgi:hypothetical protein